MQVRGYAPATPCWAELHSTDPATAAHFYRELLGWQAVDGDGPNTFTLRDLPVAGLAPAPGHASAWMVYISTEDIAATANRVAAAGGVVLQPSTGIGDRGTAAMFADPEGAAFGAWQPDRFAGARLVNELGAMCWSEVATRDPLAASEFYGKVFGWADRPGQLAGLDYREWQIGDRVVAGLLPMDDQYFAGAPAHWRLTLEVHDCAAIVTRCAELGGNALAGPIDVGVGQYAQLLDPTGASFGVIELLPEFQVTRL